MLSVCRIYWSALALIVSMILATPAYSQDDNVQKAVKKAEEAAQLYQAGEFLLAAEGFRQAYQLYPDPTLLKNQTVAYFKADACPNALRSAEQYHQSVTGKADVPAKDQADVNQITAECEYRGAKAHAAADEWEKAESSIAIARGVNPSDELITKLDSLQAEIDTARKSATKPGEIETPPETVDGMSTMSIIGWTSTGVGVALLGGALVNHIIVYSAISDLNETCTSNFCSPEDEQEWNDKADQFNTISIPLYIAGGVLTAAGVTMLILDSDDSESQVAITPEFGTDGAGVRLHISF